MTKLEKAFKSLGATTISEMEAMDQTALKKRIVEANEAMRQVAQELDDNSAYQRLKEDAAAMSAGKREVDKRQKAVILVALSLLDEKA